MSLTEILAEIPKLSFAERQQLIRRTLRLSKTRNSRKKKN